MAASLRCRAVPPTGAAPSLWPVRTADLELDLDVFAGPFDLLLAIVLREEISLLEVELGAIVLAYLEHLDDEGELDLEAATEFLVLIAALLELKSRLMLPAEEEPELDLGPEEAADELLARMLEYRRYKDAGAELQPRFAAESPYLYRSAPLPIELRRISLEASRQAYDPDRLGVALGDLLTPPPTRRHEPHPADGLARAPSRDPSRPARPRGPDRLRRRVRPRGPPHSGGDDLRAARAPQEGRGDLVAARELRPDRDHRRDRRRRPVGGGRRDVSADGSATELARVVEALLFLSPDPVPVGELIDACEVSEVQIRNALDLLAEELAPGRRGIVLREVAGGYALATDPAAEDAARRLLARPKTPAAHPRAGGDARDRRLPAAGLAARDRADPRRQLRVGSADAQRSGA